MSMIGWTEKDVQSVYRLRGESPLLAVGVKVPKKAKYGNRKKELDGHLFDSTREARRYVELKALMACGDISGLELQPRFTLQCPFTDGRGKRHRKGEYVADFSYVRLGITVAEDVKSPATKTPLWRWKWKTAIHTYPEIHFEEVE